MAENMNMMEISMDVFLNEIREDLEDEIYEPVIGIGKSGIGKTMGIYELTQELGIGFCELRLVTMTEVDILGIPKEDANGRTTYAANSLLPDAERDGESGILVLDEITSAQNTVRAAAYQLLDSKRALGEYKLPKRWKIVALGNGIEDGGVFQGMEAAFLSRATCYRIEPNAEVWCKWAMKHQINPSVIAYLKWRPENIHVFDPEEIASIFPCPRSWVALATKLTRREKKHTDANGRQLPLDADDVELYAAGAIGVDLAADFAGFYAYKGDTISPEDILSGKSDPSKITALRPEIIHLTLQSLAKQVAEELEKGRITVGEFKETCVKRVANCVNWVMKCPKLDYTLILLKDLTNSSKYFNEMVLACDDFDDACPDFLRFAEKNGVVFKTIGSK